MKFTAYQWVVMTGVAIAAGAVVTSAVFAGMTYAAVADMLRAWRIR